MNYLGHILIKIEDYSDWSDYYCGICCIKVFNYNKFTNEFYQILNNKKIIKLDLTCKEYQIKKLLE